MIQVTSRKKDRILEIKTRDGNTHYIPARARKLRVPINQKDIVSADEHLIIKGVD